MANTILTPTIIARESLRILENNLVMPKLVFNGYENEFSGMVNGYKKGASITIRRPPDFVVRQGRVMQVQDVVEGTTTLSIDQQEGVDFEFTSADLTLSVSDISERVLKPAMIQLANDIDTKLTGLYSSVPNWVGTPGQVINSFDDFAVGTERMNEFGVPLEDRYAVLSPSDNRGMTTQQTALYMQDIAKEAYRKGMIGMIDGVDTYMDQNVRTHTVGVATGTPLTNGAGQVSTYATVKDTNTQTLITDGWTNSTTGILKKGDIITLGTGATGVYAVNSVSKAVLPFLRQFVVVNDVNSDGSGNATLTITPPIIPISLTAGVNTVANATVSAAPADNLAITVMGSSNTNYRQSMMFHKNAFAFVSLPLEAPNDGRKFSRERYKGISIRVTPVYDGINDLNKWRTDVLFGVKCIDPRLATRLSGTP